MCPAERKKSFRREEFTIAQKRPCPGLENLSRNRRYQFFHPNPNLQLIPMSNQNVDNAPIAANAKRLLWAGFMGHLRRRRGLRRPGRYLRQLGRVSIGFTATQLGAIGGAGFTGFCFGIIIGGLIVRQDRLRQAGGWRRSRFTCCRPSSPSRASTPQNAYPDVDDRHVHLSRSPMVRLEAVSNPLVATLFPKQRTHYLNILHASWPAGIVAGSGRRLGARTTRCKWAGRFSSRSI
jgi:hypothetical protein